MKHSTLFAALGLVAFGAAAQEVGTVISSQPVIQQVAVPRTSCAPQVVAMQPQTSGGGGLLGAIAGGAIGSTIGGGAGTGAAIVAGTAIGAIVGNNIESNNMRAQQVGTTNCVTETTYENRTVAYNVTYEFAGRQYTTQLPYDPGSTLRLQVTPVAQAQAPAPVTGGAVIAPPVVQGTPAPVIATAPVMVQPVVVQPYPAYPTYAYPPVYYRPYYPPVSLSLGFVFGGHRHHHHRHRHFR